ncbi:MAG: cytochrome c oxidase subunit II [Planctomycetota bacterium]
MMTTLAIHDFFVRLFFGRDADSEVGYGLGSDGLFIFIWWVGVFFFVLLMALMFWWSWKYRRQPGKPAQVSASHNTVLEITWSVIPTLILVVIFFWGYDGYLKAQMPEGSSEEVDLTAYKWGWGMTYNTGWGADETVSLGSRDDIPVFYMPEDTPVLLKMSSQDVIHSFWVPDFRTKLDVMPNRYTPYSFRAAALDDADERVKTKTVKIADAERENVRYRDHWIFCAEYCGDLHSEMGAILRVVSKEDYEWWKAQPRYGVNTNPVEVGEKVYIGQGCATCHSIDGSAGTGPTWYEAYGRPVDFVDGSQMSQSDIDADPLLWDNYIRESILYPAAKLHAGYGNQMPSYDGRLSEVELRGLIAYIRSLSGLDIETENIPGFEELDEQTDGSDDGSMQANAEG